ncbi:hypothetical protein R1sor_020546 [Riccia sorocarpa]|uniref:Uncharacterized protein n=1 Tax=Riccia sorocarpa TaxID=122646 RepID=A0ABD3IJ10_9MARC
MTGKKKKKKGGDKVLKDQASTSAVKEQVPAASTQDFNQGSDAESALNIKSESEARTSPKLFEIVEPFLSLAVRPASPVSSVPQPVSAEYSAESHQNVTSPIKTPASCPGGGENQAGPSFVFSAGQNSSTSRVAGPPATPLFSTQSPESTKANNARNSRQCARRREGKCPPSERFGKTCRSRQQILQLAAQEVAFGQGRDPLSLIVAYEESGLRKTVRVPEGCTSESIVDSTLRQAVAGTALECADWQRALNHPKEDKYFAYSTAPEGLTVAKFRENKGKILVTPLSAGSGLLKLKEEAERKKNEAECKLDKVEEYLRRLQLENKNPMPGAELSGEKVAPCCHCEGMKTHIQELLQILTQPNERGKRKWKSRTVKEGGDQMAEITLAGRNMKEVPEIIRYAAVIELTGALPASFL